MECWKPRAKGFMYVYTYRTRFLKFDRAEMYICMQNSCCFFNQGCGKKEDVKGKCCVKFEGDDGEHQMERETREKQKLRC